MHGWTGTILRIDLSTGEQRREHPPAELYHRWIGGKGLAGHYLAPVIERAWDDPAMAVICMTGPLVGTPSPTSGRMCVMTRSPLTGTIGDASVGGRLGTQLKAAGLDGLIITGRSRRRCGLRIADASVTLVPCEELAGCTTDEIRTRLSEEGAVLATGPAAERGVRFANLITGGHHAAGRNGLGLAFAAKNLKYLAVRGSGRVPVHDPAALAAARADVFRQVAGSPALLGELGLAQYGTAALYDLMASRRMMPTANFRATWFAAAARLNAPELRRRYTPRRAGCAGCHILCKKVAADGTSLPEFETLSHFTALLENDDLGVAVAANVICNRLGMDTISAAATLACYAEATGQILGGERILELLRGIGGQEEDAAAATGGVPRAGARGLAEALRQGSRRWAEAQGSPELSMSVKRQELPAYDPRGAYGMALGYATSTRGGCHLRAYPISHEILRKPVATDRFSFAGKARMIKIAEDGNAVVDSLTACKFVFFASSLEEYAKAYTAVTGASTTAHDLLAAGERIVYHERMMNTRLGFTADDDDLPPRFFREPGTSGPGIEIGPIDRAAFLKARGDYYRIRGLTDEGRPRPERAAALGLAWGEDEEAR